MPYSKLYNVLLSLTHCVCGYFYYQALKSIALLRLSREGEANELVERVLSGHPGDQATLQALTLFYRDTGECECILFVFL